MILYYYFAKACQGNKAVFQKVGLLPGSACGLTEICKNLFSISRV
jgi:hypothetical protein